MIARAAHRDCPETRVPNQAPKLEPLCACCAPAQARGGSTSRNASAALRRRHDKRRQPSAATKICECQLRLPSQLAPTDPAPDKRRDNTVTFRGASLSGAYAHHAVLSAHGGDRDQHSVFFDAGHELGGQGRVVAHVHVEHQVMGG